MRKKIQEKIHELFSTAIAIKGLHGIIEIISGLILLLAKPNYITKFISEIFEHEISQDPTDLLANFAIHTSQNLSINTLLFYSMYLVIYGAINLALSISLWKEKLWAYPTAEILIFILVLFQTNRLLHTHSITLAILTLIDISILIMLNLEYKRTKRLTLSPAPKQNPNQ